MNASASVALPPAGTVSGSDERTVKGGETAAPTDSAELPALLSVSDFSIVPPSRTSPKFSGDGVASKPTAVAARSTLAGPPVVANASDAAALPTAPAVKRTGTARLAPAASERAQPSGREKGGATVQFPVSVPAPAFCAVTTRSAWLPSVTVPKSRLAGSTASCGVEGTAPLFRTVPYWPSARNESVGR